MPPTIVLVIAILVAVFLLSFYVALVNTLPISIMYSNSTRSITLGLFSENIRGKVGKKGKMLLRCYEGF